MRVASGTDGLGAARAGERWVVRVRQPDGSASDVVGWLADVDAAGDGAADGDAGGEVVLDGPVDPGLPDAAAPRSRVRLDDVVVARRAPAALGGPAVGRTSAEDLEHLAVEAWAVALEPLGAWTLRSASGFTGRANSCLAVGDPGRPVGEAAAAVEAYAAEHGIAPLAQVVTGSAEDAALRAIGWTETYVATDVLATGLAGLLGESSADARVLVSEELTDAWRAAFGAYRPTDADPAVVTRLLDGRRPRAFARVEVAGEVVAIARGHLAQGWLGVAGVWVDPATVGRAWARPSCSASVAGPPAGAPAGATCRSRRRTGRRTRRTTRWGSCCTTATTTWRPDPHPRTPHPRTPHPAPRTPAPRTPTRKR